MNAHRLRPALVGAVLALTLLAAGCGDDTTPTDQVPQLSARLDAVDEAVAARDYDAARAAIERLEHTAYDARNAGDLDRVQAEQILASAEMLRTALPRGMSSSATPSTATEESQPEETPSDPTPPDDEKPKPEPKPKPGHEPKPKHEHGHGHEKH